MENNNDVIITKSSGEQVLFDVKKLRTSLERSRAEPEAIDEIIKAVTALLFEGMSTKKIYRKAFSLLRKRSRSTAARYKLKNAILELGPAGFAFEKYVAALLRAEGYQTETDVMVQGHCVKHEVDVIAERGSERNMIECKFHGDKNIFSDVKVALYIHSRFKDIETVWRNQPEHEHKILQGWLVTNTRFTIDAQTFGECMGMNMVSWNKPSEGSLKQRIDRAGLHPLTSLTTLTKSEKKALLDGGIVLCSDLNEHQYQLDKLGISKQRKKHILSESKELCA